MLDTNAAVWWVTDHPRLGRRARSRLGSARPGSVSISAASWYEMASLEGHRDVRFGEPVAALRARLLRAGLAEQDVTGVIALDAAGLSGLSRDPFDRLIVAAARRHGATLITSDQSILEWKGELERMDARA